MSCFNCKSKLQTDIKICLQCRADDTTVIRFRDIVKKYKLTQTELNNENLCRDPCLNYDTDIIYLVSEVEALAKKLTENLDATHVKKKAYLKQKAINDKTKEDKIKINNMKIKIRQTCMDLLPKYDIKMFPEVKEHLNKLIESYCKDFNSSEFGTAIKILDDLNKFYTLKKKADDRKNDLDNLIKNNINPGYISFARNHPIYNDYIRHNKYSLNYSFEFIQKDINNMEKVNLRKKALKEELIKSGIDVKAAKSSQLYKNYVTGGQGTIVNIISNIGTEMEIEKRRTEIMNIVNNKKAKGNYKNSKFVIDYTCGNITLEVALELFEKEICDRKCDKRRSKIDKFINKNSLRLYRQQLIAYPECQKYIKEGHVNVDVMKVVLMEYLDVIVV